MCYKSITFLFVCGWILSIQSPTIVYATIIQQFSVCVCVCACVRVLPEIFTLADDVGVGVGLGR